MNFSIIVQHLLTFEIKSDVALKQYISKKFSSLFLTAKKFHACILGETELKMMNFETIRASQIKAQCHMQPNNNRMQLVIFKSSSISDDFEHIQRNVDHP